jgi:hypothetical protein
VQSALDNPVYYHELDTGASGTIWTGQTVHGLGNGSGASNVSNCGSAVPPPCAKSFMNATCDGVGSHGGVTAEVSKSSGGWSNTLRIPWAIFKQPFCPGPPARAGRLSGLSVSHSASVSYGDFVWARRRLTPKNGG